MSLVDGSLNLPEATTSTRIGLFTPAFTCPHALSDDFQNIGFAITMNVIAHCLTVISKTIAKWNRIFGLLDPHTYRQHVLGDQMISDENVNAPLTAESIFFTIMMLGNRFILADS
ncbi:MAG: hypothetical protein ACE5EK_05780 [Nitrospinales bacterium]